MLQPALRSSDAPAKPVIPVLPGLSSQHLRAALLGLVIAALIGAVWWKAADVWAPVATALVGGVLAGLLFGRLDRAELAEQARRTGEIKFHSYFDHVADGILMLRMEADGRFVYEEVNPAAEVILGLASTAVIGREPREVWPVERAAFIEARMRQCVAEGIPITTARAVDLPDGERKLCMTLALVRDSAGRVQRLVQSVLDVTERTRLEEQLRHSQRMEAIGRLTAGVAHDFNNLLQAQMGSLELLLDEVVDPSAAREYAELTLRSAERGAQLTHHLLAFARKQVLQPKAVQLPRMLSELSIVLRRTIGPQIDVTVECAPDLPAAYADPGQIEVALVNLALNARDAMEAGGELLIEASGATVDASAPEGLRGGDYVVLTVTDDGTGMPAETLEHACEPFFTTKGVNGSGLGLSMVQGFARQSGGELRISSTLGQGTSVEIWLPCAATEAPAPAPASVARLQGSGRILLVDDAPDVLLTTGAFLQGAGFDVVRAASGDHALVVLAAGERFDALVTDYAMPALNGADLILKALRLQPSLPALIITGFAEITGIENLPGQIQVLRKPFRREELVRRVKRLLETHKTHCVLSGRVANG